MFWQTGADPGVRQIGLDDKPMSVPHHLIVDGQQRLTSLYAVVTGKPVLRDDFSHARIRVAFNPYTGQFAIPDATTDKQVEWLADITLLYDDFLGVVEGYVDRIRTVRGTLEEGQRRKLFSVLDRVRDLVAYQFSVVELDATADEEQVAEVFVRINSEGVTLNQADFILTLMSVFWEKGRRNLEEFSRGCKAPSLSKASPFNWYIQPQPSQMLRVTAALAFRRAVLKQVYTVLRGKDIDTGKVDPAKREAQFKKFQESQEYVLDLTNWHEFLQCVERAGYRGSKMISSENSIIYTYALWLIGRTEHHVPLDRLREVIARWFFMAHTTARYSGSFESQFEKDLGILAGLHAPDTEGYCTILDQVVNDVLTSDFWSITFPNELATSASKSPALLAYIAALNILDAESLLSTGRVRARLDPAVTAVKGIERHHLFPRQYLRAHLGVNSAHQINQIANMALVEWSDNIKISDNPPAVYWPQQVADKSINAGFNPDRLEKQTYWHALPVNWVDLGYVDFLAARRRLMADVVHDAFLRLVDTQYRPQYPTPGARRVTDDASSSWTHYGVKIRDLLDAGLLEPGAGLTGTVDDMEVIATVVEGGNIVFGGTTYDSPSGAGYAARRAATNGWTFWVADTSGGPRTLAQLREELLRSM